MKLTKDNLKIGLNYIVVSGKTDKVKPGDTMMVEFERIDGVCSCDPKVDTFTVFRWKRNYLRNYW